MRCPHTKKEEVSRVLKNMECMHRTYENLRSETGNFATTVKAEKSYLNDLGSFNAILKKIDRIKPTHV
jgi:hypothetical protein